jgi:hypothetical protein
MRREITVFAVVTMLGFGCYEPHAKAQAITVNLHGSYRCEPQPVLCRSGQTFSLMQSGDTLQLKSDNGEQAEGRLTSDITLSAGPPWNMLGVVYDGAIEWSNGTKWHKQ